MANAMLAAFVNEASFVACQTTVDSFLHKLSCFHVIFQWFLFMCDAFVHVDTTFELMINVSYIMFWVISSIGLALCYLKHSYRGYTITFEKTCLCFNCSVILG